MTGNLRSMTEVTPATVRAYYTDDEITDADLPEATTDLLLTVGSPLNYDELVDELMGDDIPAEALVDERMSDVMSGFDKDTEAEIRAEIVDSLIGTVQEREGDENPVRGDPGMSNAEFQRMVL